MNQLREIVALADGVLGRDAVGIYLHGSAVLGGLRPASDLDVLLDRPAEPPERAALTPSGRRSPRLHPPPAPPRRQREPRAAAPVSAVRRRKSSTVAVKAAGSSSHG